MNFSTLPIWVYFLAGFAGFILFWSLICFLIALTGGWFTLARYFRAHHKPAGRYQAFGRALVGGSKYTGALLFGFTNEGFYLAVIPIFRPGHPPLLIPWNEFGPLQEKKHFWLTSFETKIKTGKFGGVVLTFFDQNTVREIERFCAENLESKPESPFS